MERLVNTKKHVLVSIAPNFKIKLPKAKVSVSVKNYNGTKVTSILYKDLKLVYSNYSNIMFFNVKQQH